MPLIDADINNVPDQENVVSSNQRISLKGKTRVYFILFMSLHVRVSFSSESNIQESPQL